MLLNASYRDSKRVETSDQFLANAAATTGSGGEARLKIGTAEGSWVINPRSFATFKYTHFANQTLGHAGQRRRRRRLDGASGTRLDIASLDSQGRLTVPVPVAGPDRLQRLRPAAHRPLRLRRRTACSVGGGIVGLRLPVRRQRLLPRRRPGRLQPDARARACTHELHVGYQCYEDAEDLVRSSNGWGLITVPGGRLAASRARPIFYTARIPAADGAGSVPPIHSEYQSQNIELNDTIRWQTGPSTSACSPATTRSTARACARTRPRSPGYALGARATSTRCTRSPFGKMIQPRARRDLGLQRHGHRLRQLRAVQPGGELAAARRVLGPQPGRRPSSTPTSTPTACCSAPSPWPRPPASCSSTTSTRAPSTSS